MKGLILCGGTGSRLWPITLSIQKQLIPIANKPLLFYILDSLLKANIKEIGIVINEHEETFRKILKKYEDDVIIRYIKQEKPVGLADATYSGRNFIKDDNFIMILGDNLYELNIENSIQRFIDKKVNCHLLLKEVADPKRFGIANICNDSLIDVIEKPNIPPTNLAITGMYIFDKNIFTACKKIKPSWRGEYEITDAIKWLLNNEYKVSYEIFDGSWKDLGKPEDVLEANVNQLKKIRENVLGSVDNSKVVGKIDLGSNSQIINSIVNGPVSIGENTIIRDSFLGAYTSISNNVKITNARLENCIILDGCRISNVNSTIASSIIERDSRIEKASSNKGYNLLLGKNSRVLLP